MKYYQDWEHAHHILSSSKSLMGLTPWRAPYVLWLKLPSKLSVTPELHNRLSQIESSFDVNLSHTGTAVQ